MSSESNWLEFFENRERLYAEYYLDFARQHARRDPEALIRLETEIGNLLKSADWLADHSEGEDILTLATALWQESDFLRSRGYMQRGLPLLERAREAAQVRRDVEAEFKWLEAVAHVHLINGNLTLSQPLYEQALNLAKSNDYPLLEAHAQLGLGGLFTDLGELDKAVVSLKDALHIYRVYNENDYEVTALTRLGNALCLQGCFVEAIDYLQSSLPKIYSRQNKWGEAEINFALGYAAALAEDWSQAINHFEISTEIAHEIGDRFREVRGLHNLGEAWLELGDASKAVMLLETAVVVQEVIDDVITKSFTHFFLVKAYRELNALDECLSHVEKVSPLGQLPILTALVIEAELIKAEIYLEQGQSDLAESTLIDVLQLAPEHMHEMRHRAQTLLANLQGQTHQVIYSVAS